MNQKILTGAIVNGVINAIINGSIKWFSFKNEVIIPVSVDSITNNDLTVLGSAVPL